MAEQDLEEVAKKIFPKHKGVFLTASNKIMLRRAAWVKGAKWQQEQMQELHKSDMHKCASFWRGVYNEIEKSHFDEWYNETFKTK